LVAVHEKAGSTPQVEAARREALQRAIATIREALASEPLEVPLLRRLKELYEWSARGLDDPSDDGDDDDDDAAPAADAAAGALVAGQLLGLAGEDVDVFPTRRRELRGILPVGFWSRLRVPGTTGFVAEIWPMLAAALGELFPPNASLPNFSQLSGSSPRDRERIPPGTEPRLAWVEAAAISFGVPALELWMPKKGSAGADAGDESVMVVEGDSPGLLLARGVLTGNAPARFRVGRMLSLLRDRTFVLERVPAGELSAMLAAAAVVAGAPIPKVGAPAGLRERARALSKAMSRKDRKALELEVSRFLREVPDAAGFREAVLATADRLGLILAADVAVAVRVAGDFDLDREMGLTSAAIVDEARVMTLVRFALSDDYLVLKREMGAGGS
ncbi:MAG: hypothetical protein H7X95_11475, partial [Deltaproteobacteria bacterium]|nr:hypothetical protein [Deltaproteobacteria bacterium]